MYWIGRFAEVAIYSTYQQRPSRAKRLSYLVFEDKNVLILHEVAIDVFQGAISCFWVEEVYQRHERSIKGQPYNVELPMQGFDPYRGNLNHDEITCTLCVSMDVRSLMNNDAVLTHPIRGCSQCGTLILHR